MPAPRSTPADVREAILQHATRLFAGRGYSGVSLNDIAAAVGIRKPSLLYHFASKEQLRQAVLEKLLAHWNDVLPRLLVAATAGEGQFDAVLTEMIAFFAADPDRARLLLREALDRPDEMRALIQGHVTSWVEIVCNTIRKGQEQGRIHAGVDPEAYVVQVINLVLASIATHQTIGGLLPGGPQRNYRELLRVTKQALFRAGGEPRQGDQR